MISIMKQTMAALLILAVCSLRECDQIQAVVRVTHLHHKNTQENNNGCKLFKQHLQQNTSDPVHIPKLHRKLNGKHFEELQCMIREI